MKTVSIIFISCFMCACSTMNFVNGPTLGDTVKREQWHHLAAASLIELSQPFNASYYCDNKQWEKLSVQLTPPNVFATSAFAPISFVYNPWTIEYECRDSIDE